MEIVKAHTRASDLKIPDIVPQTATPSVADAIVDGSRIDWANINGNDGVSQPEGAFYTRMGLNSIKFLQGRPAYNFNLVPISPMYSVGPGEKKAVRVTINGATMAETVFTLNTIKGAQLFYSNSKDIIGVQWIQFDYAANGVLNWYVNGSLEYTGSPGQRVIFNCGCVAPNYVFTLDCGLAGGSPPAGYSWL